MASPELERPELRLVTDEEAVRVHKPPRGLWPSARSVLLVAGLLVTAGILGLTGFVVYRQLQEEHLRELLKRADIILATDTAEDVVAAEALLRKAERQFGPRKEILERLAWVLIQRWGRFGGGAEVRREVDDLVARISRKEPESEVAALLQAARELYAGRWGAAAARAERALVNHPRSARLAYVLGMARFRLGGLGAAQATLQLSVSYDARFLPARYHLAVVERLRGHRRVARRHIEEVLGRSPGHLGARLERAFLDLLSGRRLSGGELEELASRTRASRSPEYEARLLGLRGLVAEQRGDWQEAADQYLRAAAKRPQEPEYALGVIRAKLGHDVAGAVEVEVPAWRSLREYAGAAMLLTRRALLAGRTKEAAECLGEFADRGGWEGQVELEALGLWWLRLEGRWTELAGRCRKFLAGGREHARQVLDVCALHAWRVRDRRLLQAVVDGAPPVAEARYRAVSEMLRGRSREALRLLARIPRAQLGPLWEAMVAAVTATDGPRAGVSVAKEWHIRSGGSAEGATAWVEALEAVGQDARRVRAYLRRDLRIEAPWLRFRLAVSRLRWSRRGRGKGWETGNIGEWPKWLQSYYRGLDLVRRKRYLPAVRAFREAGRSGGPWIVDLAAAWGALAGGDRLGAGALYASVYEKSGRDPWVLERQFQRLLEVGAWKEALRVGLAAARAYRRQRAWRVASRIYATLADRLSRTEGHDKRLVRRLFRRAVRLPETSPVALRLLGEYERRRGRYGEALRWLERAVAAAADDPDALFALAALLVARKQEPGRAVRLLRSFLLQEKRGWRARKAKRWLRRLRRDAG